MKYISTLDLFKTPFFLKFEKKFQISTNLGVFISLGLIIFLLMNFIISDVFYKGSPKIANYDFINEQSPLINYSTKVFTIAVEDENSLAYGNPDMFTINITNSFMISNDDGKSFQFLKNITKNLHVCKPEDFPDKVYYSLGFENNFCMDDSYFETEGYWTEKSISYLEIDILLCDNVTYEGKCRSIEEIKNFFNRKYFSIYYQTFDIDTSNYMKPLFSIINNDFYLVDVSLRKTLYIYLKNFVMSTDDAFILSNNHTISDTTFDRKEVDLYFEPNISNNNPLFKCVLYSSHKTQVIQRTYQKISEALANLGGIASVLLSLGYILTSFEKKLDIKKKVMNGLYSFPETKISKTKKNKDKKELELKEKQFSKSARENEKNSLQKIQIFNKNELILENNNNIKEIQQSSKLNNSMKNSQSKYINQKVLSNDNFPSKDSDSIEENNKIIQKNPSKNFFNRINQKNISCQKLEKIKIIIKFQEFMKKSSQKALNFNIFEYFILNFKQLLSFRLNEKEKLFLKGVEIFETKLDIVCILKKLQEIEKLKIILFNEEQLSLFNLLDKPLIYLEENDKEANRLDSSRKMAHLLKGSDKNSLNILQVKEIIDHFNKLKKSSKITNLDERLLDLMDKNLKNFIDNF